MNQANTKLFAVLELMERGLSDKAHELLKGLCDDFRRHRPLEYDQTEVDRVVHQNLPDGTKTRV